MYFKILIKQNFVIVIYIYILLIIACRLDGYRQLPRCVTNLGKKRNVLTLSSLYPIALRGKRVVFYIASIFLRRRLIRNIQIL